MNDLEELKVTQLMLSCLVVVAILAVAVTIGRYL